jgi:hypothetical protein
MLLSVVYYEMVSTDYHRIRKRYSVILNKYRNCIRPISYFSILGIRNREEYWVSPIETKQNQDTIILQD